MFHQFFKQSLKTLKSNPRLIENTVGGLGIAVSVYHYPESSRKWTQHHMTMFYNRLSEEEKLALKQDPKKEQKFIEECKDRLRLIIGPPD
ncbi:MAG: hypothetical protein Q8R83_03890 [Legionellaceae bacterium]|nr:hypothetical protein [Legionellaceae bacterium]